MSNRFRCRPYALEEELMSKDKQRREAKKPKKKAPKADPAARRTPPAMPVRRHPRLGPPAVSPSAPARARWD